MAKVVDVAIIGAGPYGLSLAAHLSACGIDFRVFGVPMESWKTGMPPGMILKSTPSASNLYDPSGFFTLRRFCADREAPYHDILMGLPLDSFVSYGEAFQRRYAPSVERKKLTSLSQSGDGYIAEFDDGESVEARYVVVAVGLHPFKHTTQALKALPEEVRSHSGDYGPLDGLRGKRVAVVGAGASASDLAGLLHEQGTQVSLVTASPELRFASLPRLATLRERVLAPANGIGRGWGYKACAEAPWLTRVLPTHYRLRLAAEPGPLGGAFMKDRVIGKVPLFVGHTVTGADVHGDRVRLMTATRDGAAKSMEFDHVIAATGYQVDVDRFSFLDSNLKTRIRRLGGAPDLSLNYESSAPGLYFIGPASANSFGPVARSVFGAYHPARRLAHVLSLQLGQRPAESSDVLGAMSAAVRKTVLR